MDYLITGVTGLIGSHILYEYLKEALENNNRTTIHVLIRPKGEQSALERLKAVLHSSKTPAYLHSYSEEELLKGVSVIPHNLHCDNLKSAIEESVKGPFILIHGAASTNLMPGASARKDILKNNTEGTERLLAAMPLERLSKIVYLSTAFSCGIQTKEIAHTYTHADKASFRNHYEEQKAFTECYIAQLAKKYKKPYKIIRPAVVCGRLIDSPLYYTTKFDVFYGWAGFFHKVKDNSKEQQIRLYVNSQGTLNIVPVDYVAKITCKAIEQDDIVELNIINNNPPKHVDYIPKIMNEIGGFDFSFVNTIPLHTTPMETLYYKTAGQAFAPYIATTNQQFSATLLEDRFPDIPCPDILGNFESLIGFAIENNFGKMVKAQ